jgi:DNA-binding NarL/FixJ family response regulator
LTAFCTVLGLRSEPVQIYGEKMARTQFLPLTWRFVDEITVAKELATSTGAPAPIRVYLAQPRELIREGLHARLVRDGRFEVVGSSATPDTERIQHLQPDVVVLDPREGEMLDVSLLEEVNRVSPSSRIVVFTRLVDPNAVLTALGANVRGYFSRARYVTGDFFCEALVVVGRYGGTIVGPEIALELAASTSGAETVPEVPPDFLPLSEREREILGLLVEGLNDAEAADRLCITESTVATHVRSMLAKVRAQTRLQLGFRAAQHDLLG